MNNHKFDIVHFPDMFTNISECSNFYGHTFKIFHLCQLRKFQMIGKKKLLKETLWMHILGTIYNSCRVIKCYLNKLCLFYPRTKFSITFACVPSYYSDQPSHLHCLIWSYYGYWGPLFLHATNWRSSQTAWLCRHVWVYAGCLCGFVGIAVLWLSFHLIWKLLHAS